MAESTEYIELKSTITETVELDSHIDDVIELHSPCIRLTKDGEIIYDVGKYDEGVYG
jgi:hypothetical protein